MVAQGAQAARAGGEGRAARGGPEGGPDGVVLEAAGLAAGAEVGIGGGQAGGVHAGHTRLVGGGIEVRILHFIHWKRLWSQAAAEKERRAGGERVGRRVRQQ